MKPQGVHGMVPRRFPMLLLMVLACGQTLPQNKPAPDVAKFEDINVDLMKTTFCIQGQTAIGTGFLVGRAIPNDPTHAKPVLVTAAHVLNAMAGNSVNVIMRRKEGNSWQEVPVPLEIRSGGRELWVQHSTADVAAIYISIPGGLVQSVSPPRYLATDKALEDYHIHPGDDLNVLGFPLGYKNPGGFPVLRSGKIASYPLTPAAEHPYFLMDFRVFKGNSGGPVYFVPTVRVMGSGFGFGFEPLIMGLVSEEVSYTETVQSLYENKSEMYPLSLAKIVPAQYILETVNMLPEPVAAK